MLWLKVVLFAAGGLILLDLIIAWVMIFKYLWRCPSFDARERLRSLTGEISADMLEVSLTGLDWLEGQTVERVVIPSRDGFELSAFMLPADAPTDKTILCIHGFRSSGHVDFGASIRYMHEQGCNVLVPDDRAHGESGGHFIGFGYTDRRDIMDWCHYLEGRFGEQCRVLLLGISMGGAAVISAAGDSELPSCVRGVLSDCPFSSGWDELSYQMKQLFGLPAFPILHTADAMLRIFAGYSLRRERPLDMASNISIPLLLVHGLSDSFVPPYMSEQIYAAADCDKRLILVEGATHGVSYCVDMDTYRAAMIELLRKCGMTE